MKNNKIMLAFATLIAMSLTGCGEKPTPSVDPSNDTPSNNVSESIDTSVVPSDSAAPEPSYDSVSKEEEFTGLIPEKVLNAEIEIDFLVYIEGQNGIMQDIGHYSTDPNENTRWHPADLTSIEMAKYFGAASAFKKLAPGVKINLWYCQIAEYDTTLRDYYSNNGHFPQLMWATDNVVEMLANGYSYDVSCYEDTEYYQQYNEYFLSRFNFGGFQAAIPIAAEPWGVFVNMDDVQKYNSVSDVIDDNNLCTDEYKDWVDNFTWEKFMELSKNATTETHAGVSKVTEYFSSYSLPTVNAQFIREGTVDLTSPEVEQQLDTLLNYENELSKYAVYKYDAESFGNQLIKKDAFTNAAAWLGTQNFVQDKYSTFYAEAPWALGTIAQYVKQHNLDTKVDFLPYPKLDESSTAYTGIAVEGLTVGNQCPVGTPCTSQKQLEMDVASYFAMFMGLDPRSIDSRSKVQYRFDGIDYTGDLTLPLSKQGSRFSWQDNDEFVDPAADYDGDNWKYQLGLWLDLYDLYVTDGKKADLDYFSNITYGLVKMLDSIYALPDVGDDDYVTCLNFWNEPVEVPDMDAGDDSVKDIFRLWQGRFSTLRDTETNAGALGTDTYYSTVKSRLAEIEAEINDNAEIAWAYLQECVDNYYGLGLYDVTDRSYRNDYEGAL